MTLLESFSECRKESSNYQKGAVSFDNIVMSFLSVFQIITLEDWSVLMYTVQDGYSFWVWPFFVVLILLGSWFAINLALVVIATQFRVTKKRETMLMQSSASAERWSWGDIVMLIQSFICCDSEKFKRLRERDERNIEKNMNPEERKDLQMIKEVFDLLDEDRDGSISVDELRSALQVLDSHLPKSDLKELAESIDKDGNGYIDFEEFRTLMGLDSESNSQVSIKSSPDNNSSTTSALHKMHQLTNLTWMKNTQQHIRAIVNHRYFKIVVIACIVINTIFMSAEHHGQPESLTTIVEITNGVFAFVFLFEVILRLASMGFSKYFLDLLNFFDFLIAVLGIMDVFSDATGSWAVLRSFRLLRMFKLARYCEPHIRTLRPFFKLVQKP